MKGKTLNIQEEIKQIFEAEAETRYPVKTHMEPENSPYKNTKKTFLHGCRFGYEIGSEYFEKLLKVETFNKKIVCERGIYPIAIGLDSDDERTQIICANGWHIAYIEYSPTNKIAQRIVTAVNSYDDMLEALKKANAIILEMGAIIRRIDDDNDHSDFWTLDGEYVPGCEFIQAAIAKATNTE